MTRKLPTESASYEQLEKDNVQKEVHENVHARPNHRHDEFRLRTQEISDVLTPLSQHAHAP